MRNIIYNYEDSKSYTNWQHTIPLQMYRKLHSKSKENLQPTFLSKLKSIIAKDKTKQ